MGHAQDRRIAARYISLQAGDSFGVRLTLDEDLTLTDGDDVFVTISIGYEHHSKTQTWRINGTAGEMLKGKTNTLITHQYFANDGPKCGRPLHVPPPPVCKYTWLVQWRQSH